MVEADLCLFFDDFSSSPLPIIGFQWAIFGKTHFVLSCTGNHLPIQILIVQGITSEMNQIKP